MNFGWNKHRHNHVCLVSNCPKAPVPLGKYIFDGDIITFGNTQLEAIHVPGHSPGSIVFYCKEAHCISAVMYCSKEV